MDTVLIPEMVYLSRQLFDGMLECTLHSGNVGGHLHVVLDDPNFEDAFVREGLKAARDDGCHLCALVALSLLTFTEDERETIYMELHGMTESPYAQLDESGI